MQVRITLLATLALVGLSPGWAMAQGLARGEVPSRPVGFSASAGIGGGGVVAGSSLFELEVVGGLHVGFGFSPELGLALGIEPVAHVAVRPGLHYAIPETPFYARLAFDAGSPEGSLRWRWLMLGAGGELRFTDVLGGYAELDTGVPIGSGAGVPLLVRAGLFLSY